MPRKPTTHSKLSNSKKHVSESRVPSKVTEDTNNSSGLDPEVEDRFKLELCWCIQQLETSLTTGKLQDKQAQGLSKYLQSLKSNNASLIRKRQIMRNIFGDYREKMAKDERKLSKTAATVKFTHSASVNKKSVFIKKAAQHNLQEFKEQADDHNKQNTSCSTQQIIDINKTQSPFQFNFQMC